jgi:hypothetical protein
VHNLIFPKYLTLSFTKERNTVKPLLNGPFIRRNFVLNGNIFRSCDYHSIPWSNGNLASAEKCSGPLRFRLRQVYCNYLPKLLVWRRRKVPHNKDEYSEKKGEQIRPLHHALILCILYKELVINYDGFEAPTAVTMKSTVSRAVMQRSLHTARRFGRTSIHRDSSAQLGVRFCSFLAWLTPRSWRWWRCSCETSGSCLTKQRYNSENHSALYGTRRFITVSTRARCWNVFNQRVLSIH